MDNFQFCIGGIKLLILKVSKQIIRIGGNLDTKYSIFLPIDLLQHECFSYDKF